MKRNEFQRNSQSVPEENNHLEKANWEEVIKQWSPGKFKELEELISVTKYRDACKIEICDLGKTFCNQKQVVAHSSKDHKKCASSVKSETDTI